MELISGRIQMFYCIAIIVFSFNYITSMHVDGNFRHNVYTKDKCDKKNPIVLIPGLFGSRLHGHINMTENTSKYCRKSYPYHRLWVNTFYYALNLNCFTHAFSLKYNNVTNTMEDQDGVKVGADNFGDIETVASLDTNIFHSTKYFHAMAHFIINLGWAFNGDIVAAPYDFRKIPLNKTKDEYFQNLKELVEKLRMVDGCKAVLISHSMGSPLARIFLASMGQKWINENMRAWVSLNGAFVGSKSAIISRTYGLSSWGLGNFLKAYVQSFASTFPSIYFLQPSRSYFGDDLPIAQTSQENFTLRNMTNFQRVIIGENQQHMENIGIPDIWTNSTAFHVRFLCIYSTGYNTITGAKLNDDYTLDGKNIEFGDGDGTLSIDELQSCERVAASMKKRKTRIVHLPNVGHEDILKIPETLRYIELFLTRLTPKAEE